MIFVYVIGLMVGIGFLWFAGDKTVHYAVGVADATRLSKFFVGFTFLGFSVGLPELCVTLASIFRGVPGLAAGNLFGANFSDISLVIGLPVLVAGTLHVSKKEISLMLIILSIIMALTLGILLLGELYWWHGVVLIAAYVFCLWFLWQKQPDRVKISQEVMAGKTGILSKKSLYIKLIVSLIVMIIAAEISVRSSIAIAGFLGISIATIGSTIFALGTSLPEVSLNIHAIRRKEYALVLSNSLGSVLVQGGFILGILALATRAPLDLRSLRTIIPFMLLAFLIVGYTVIKQQKIRRRDGIVLLITFIAFWIIEYVVQGLL